MRASLLEEKVLEIVQDPSYEGKVLPFLNRGISWITGKLKLSYLDAEDTVLCTSTDNKVLLPDNYMHGLYYVGDGQKRIGDPNYYNEFPRFARYHQDLSKVGRIRDVAVRGQRELYYVDREDKELTIRFFELPDLLSGGSSEPECLPIHLHEPLLVNFAAWKIYELIEDGIEDPKSNGKVYQNHFMSYLADLSMYTVNTSEPLYVQDEATGIF